MYRLIFFVLFFPLGIHTQPMVVGEILNKSIHYHDPSGKWGRNTLRLHLMETRPGSADRETDLLIDLQTERFEMTQLRDGRQLFHRLEKGICTHQLDGREILTKEEIETFRLTCERTTTMRDYYTYLWGLPMKLKDDGTIIDDEVIDTRFNERECWGIKVTYSPEVGKDTWYFYFDKNNFALIGYRFYHNEAKNDGEYIILEEEIKLGGLKLPKVRKWFTHEDNTFLGMDKIVKQ